MGRANLRRLLLAGLIVSPLAALYCLGGIVQAASLFVGERAQRNFELWGALFVLFVVLFIGCGIGFAITKYRVGNSKDEGRAI